jgi:hypothetical protein
MAKTWFMGVSVYSYLRSQYHIAVMRLDNRWQDFRAVLAGACNQSTWTGKGYTGYAGGYSHWRCGKKRGHAGPHRFNNYTWTGKLGDRADYNPIPSRTPENSSTYNATYGIPFMKLANGRRVVDRRSRSRQKARLVEAYHERRRTG